MRKSLIFLGLVLASLAAAGAADAQPAADPCAGCVSVRVGRPIAVRGPSGPNGDEIDAPLSVIRLPDGRFRGFIGNHVTLAIDGDKPWDLGGPARLVLQPGPKGSGDECGNWITSILPDRDRLVALIHNEQVCDYREDQTHKAMSVGVSTDHGLTWKILGPVITGRDTPQKGRVTGEGDCTAVDGGDRYLYAYCLRQRDGKIIAARALLSDPSRFSKWDGSGWNAPGLEGNAAALAGFPGMAIGYWKNAKTYLAMSAIGSLRLSLSSDRLRFQTLAEPLVLYDADNWRRPAPTDLYGYPSLIGDDGFNQLGNHFLLAYMYVPPGADFTQRFIVMHDVWIATTRAPATPQVGLALSRWSKPNGALWTTTGPAIEDRNRLAYTFDRTLGYLMTAAPAGMPSIRLAECAGQGSGQPDYVLAEDGACTREGFRRLRSAGFVYRERQPGTIPLYRCLATRGNAHFGSSDSNCEGRGSSERLLGYMLEK